jgi:hypothetical protein
MLKKMKELYEMGQRKTTVHSAVITHGPIVRYSPWYLKYRIGRWYADMKRKLKE